MKLSTLLLSKPLLMSMKGALLGLATSDRSGSNRHHGRWMLLRSR